MGDPLSSLIRFLTDAEKNLITRIFTGVFIVILLIVIDNTLGFSYYYNNARKLEQVQKLNSIVQDTSLQESEIVYLGDLRRKIIYRETWKEQIENLVYNFEFKDSEKELNGSSSKEEDEVIPMDPTWHFLTSSWFFLFLMVVVPFQAITEYKKQGTAFGAFFAFVVMEAILLLIAFGIAYLFSFLPRITVQPWPNYLINVVLGGGLLIIVAIWHWIKPQTN